MTLLPTTPSLRVDDIMDAPLEPPRFAHIDDAALAAISDLYREILPIGGAILDVMSGWVSHLPPEIPIRGWSGLAAMRANWPRTRFSTSGEYRI